MCLTNSTMCFTVLSATFDEALQDTTQRENGDHPYDGGDRPLQGFRKVSDELEVVHRVC